MLIIMMTRISIATVFLLFLVFQCITSITIRPDQISITTSKPTMMKIVLKKQQPTMNKSNKTDEMQVVAGDNRIRRLIPSSAYAPHYNQNSDFNYFPMHPMILRKKPQQQQSQIPSIAVLYNKYPQQPRPNVQAGFIYKIRQPATHQQQSHMPQPSYNSFKYQHASPSVYHPNPNAANNKHQQKIYSPFSEQNKIPGEFVPIFKTKNLPYKSFNDVKVVTNDDDADAVSHAAPLVSQSSHQMRPYDEEEFVPMIPPSQYHHYQHHRPSTSSTRNHLYRSKIKSPTKHPKFPSLTHFNSDSPIFYVTPSTTSERPQETERTHYSPSPVSETEHDDALSELSSPDYYRVKVTTFSPNAEYRKKVHAATFVNNVEIDDDSITNLEDDISSPLPPPPLPSSFPHAEIYSTSSEIPEALVKFSEPPQHRKIIKVLSSLKSNDIALGKVKKPHSKHHDYDYSGDEDDGSDSSTKYGRPGVDYPNFHEIPPTNFSCRDQRYKGFFGDPDTNCQVWHYCDLNGGKASFLCPNGTIFSQATLTCDWWFNVKCSSTTQLYVLNERLYKFILPFQPKFPEDYSGPLVDKYLEIRFQEMEEKMRHEKEKGRKSGEDSGSDEKDNQNEIDDELPGGTEEGADETAASSSDETSYLSVVSIANTEKAVIDASTADSLKVPTTTQSIRAVTGEVEATASTSEEEQQNFIVVTSELPPRPHFNVEQERLEVIEIKHDGASGHLTHDN